MRAEDNGEERRITLKASTTVSISLLFLAQCGYVIFMLGRQAERLETVALTVSKIEANQYTAKEAAHDLGELRREDEKINFRVRDLEVRVVTDGRGR